MAITVTFNGQLADGGSVPLDPVVYETGEDIVIPNNLNGLYRTGYYISNWNILANGLGLGYLPANVGTAGVSPFDVDRTLYSIWVSGTYPQLKYSDYNSDSGTVPSAPVLYSETDEVYVLDNTGTLARTGYSFNGWNTSVNGVNGVQYDYPTDFITMGVDYVALFPQWSPDSINSIKHYNGSAWVDGVLKYYNGSAWVEKPLKRWNGSAWA